MDYDFEKIKKRALELQMKEEDARVEALVANATTPREELRAYAAAKLHAGFPGLSADATPEEIDNFYRDCKAYQDVLAGNADLDKSKEQKKKEAAKKQVRKLLGKE
jgi:hypothetical protein